MGTCRWPRRAREPEAPRSPCQGTGTLSPAPIVIRDDTARTASRRSSTAGKTASAKPGIPSPRRPTGATRNQGLPITTGVADQLTDVCAHQPTEHRPTEPDVVRNFSTGSKAAFGRASRPGHKGLARGAALSRRENEMGARPRDGSEKVTTSPASMSPSVISRRRRSSLASPNDAVTHYKRLALSVAMKKSPLVAR